MSTRPALSTILRDLAAWIIGACILFKQAGIFWPAPAEVSETLVWVGALFVGGPGVLTALAAILAGIGIGSSPSRPAEQALPRSSSGAPSEGEA